MEPMTDDLSYELRDELLRRWGPLGAVEQHQWQSPRGNVVLQVRLLRPGQATVGVVFTLEQGRALVTLYRSWPTGVAGNWHDRRSPRYELCDPGWWDEWWRLVDRFVGVV